MKNCIISERIVKNIVYIQQKIKQKISLEIELSSVLNLKKAFVEYEYKTKQKMKKL